VLHSTVLPPQQRLLSVKNLFEHQLDINLCHEVIKHFRAQTKPLKTVFEA